MEHIPAIRAAKVGMRCPARVVLPSDGHPALILRLDFTRIAPGRSPNYDIRLQFTTTVSVSVARALRAEDWIEVVLTEVSVIDAWPLIEVSLPADPAWLAWNNGTVRQLAQRIRDTGETVLFPILADALEEAGCNERELLARCRSPEHDDLTWLVTLLATQE